MVPWSSGLVLLLFCRSTGAHEHRSKLIFGNCLNLIYFNIIRYKNTSMGAQEHESTEAVKNWSRRPGLAAKKGIGLWEKPERVWEKGIGLGKNGVEWDCLGGKDENCGDNWGICGNRQGVCP